MEVLGTEGKRICKTEKEVKRGNVFTRWSRKRREDDGWVRNNGEIKDGWIQSNGGGWQGNRKQHINIDIVVGRRVEWQLNYNSRLELPRIWKTDMWN